MKFTSSLLECISISELYLLYLSGISWFFQVFAYKSLLNENPPFDV
ncbi:hypothetical protein SAMN05660903_03582 [Salegentibacter salinarum]|nr:hypothetical protein SAMN05660903_03582 [Salegentibacter salinarum]